jgi:hypothetical protein
VTKPEAKAILSVYRPRSADADDPEFAEALALARQDAELGRWFDDHCAVHSAIRARFRQITVPEGLKEQIISEHKARSVVVRWRRPALLAAAAIVLVLVSLAALWLSRTGIPPEDLTLNGFRGQMVRAAVKSAYGMDLETNDVSQIRSYLAQQNAHGDFQLPKSLASTACAGCGVLAWQGNRVTMVCFRSGRPLSRGAKTDLFLFIIERKAVPNPPPSAVPQLAQANRISTASWTSGELVYVLAADGDMAFLRKYL